MHTIKEAGIRRPPRRLCAVIAAVLGLEASAAHADWMVTSCADDLSGNLAGHTGTLRYAAANATSGDFIYFANGLGCNNSTISLTTGAILVNADSVYIVGPESYRLTISTKYLAADKKDRVFRHTGAGKLTFRNLTVAGGDFYLPSGLVRGGCVFSAGSVELRNSTVEVCKASTNTSTARGGAVYASKDLLVTYGSAIIAGTADGGSNGDAKGGGYALGDTLIEYSTIANNTAKSNDGSHGIGGGLIARGSVSILGSSVFGNFAAFNVGGVFADSLTVPTANHISIVNSTISGNTAGFAYGGMALDAPTIDIRNSTIAFNEAGHSGYAQPAGVELVSGDISPSFEVESTIIANNTSDAGATPSDFFATHAVFGSHNLIFKPDSPAPFGTLVGACPRLGRLRTNGGVTLTHALLTGSPARDAGADGGKEFDQRSRTFINHVADCARVSGPQADIGAYEVDQADVVFNVDFEGCPSLP